MKYSVFRESVKLEIRKILGADFDVRLHSATKNNGICLWAIVIKEANKMVAPTIYLEEYYEKYVTSICDIRTIADDIIECFYKHKDDIEFDIEYFKDYDKIKSDIRCKIVNTKKNEKLLNKIPHIDFLDLSIVFYCVFSENAENTQTCLIYNSHLTMWSIGPNDLYKIAVENTMKFNKYEIKPIGDIINELIDSKKTYELTGKSCEQEVRKNERLETKKTEGYDDGKTEEEQLRNVLIKEINESEFPMFVLTNKRRLFGAVCILYKDLLKKIAEILDNDFYILPSSIHEIILVPYKSNESSEMYKNIVADVNMHEVFREEVLSDNVYQYCRSEEQIILL